MATPAPAVVTRQTLAIPTLGFPGSKVTPAQIVALKNHVIACADHIMSMKVLIGASQKALDALPPADVEAAVVQGYPPPAA